MVGVNKLKQMVGVAINTYLVAQRELEYHLVTLLCSRWASRAELLRSLNNISNYASHSIKLKQMVGVAINTYLVAVAQRELAYHLVTLLCSRWASRAALVRITFKQTQANGWCQQTQANGWCCNQYIFGRPEGA